MERIDCFAVDIHWNDLFTRAELASGCASALKSIEVTNVGGGPRDWLNLCLEVDREPVWRKRVENVSSCGCVTWGASAPLPSDLTPGTHQCRLKFSYGGQSSELSRSIEVLGDDYICVRMDRAELLAASVAVSGEALSNFANEATRGIDHRDRWAILCALYDALLARHLPYQPVSPLTRPDHQRINSAASTLEYGGSCADLSLLFAGLCFMKGMSPVLLLLQGHMMAGAWLIDPPEIAPRSNVSGQIMALVDSDAVALLDVVALCRGLAVEQAITDARARLGRDVPMALVDVRAALRSGVASIPQSPVSAPEPVLSVLICGLCGYDQFDPSELSGPTVKCPACERLIRVPAHLRSNPGDAPSEDVAATPEPVRPARPQVLSGEVARCCLQGLIAVAKSAAPGAEAVRVPEVWQGRPVVRVDAQAFDGCRMESVALPDGLSAIGDYAFRQCGRLTAIALPDGLSELGVGAFSGCGALVEAHIPGSLKRIPRAAFAHCAALRHVTNSDGVVEIDEYAFEGCTALTDVSLPASVQRVRANAFSGCTRLTEAHLASDATQIDPRAFNGTPLKGF